MKISSCRIFLVLLVVVFSYSITFKQVFAAKKNSPVTQALKVFNNKGEGTVYGSVLSPKEDEINISLPKAVIEKIRKAGLDKLTCSLTSKLDTTKTFSIPTNSITIQNKKIKNISRKYLVISLFNLTAPSGITLSPSSLPEDDYKIKILADNIDLTTDSFNYKTPALVVGTVDSKTAALVTVEDLDGNQISDSTVASNPNGSFFTEVRANKIGLQTKARRYLKAQTTGDGDEINAALVHCVADRDLYAVTFLDPDKNADITNKDLQVDEDSTLTANLAKENEELAFEVAKDQLQGLEDEENGDNEDYNITNSSSSGNTSADEDSNLSCNIDQFTLRCTSDSEDVFSLIGKDFKTFLQGAKCNFPQFDLIKKIILASSDNANSFIGKGYCEHYTREIDDNKSCQTYEQILSDYKSGKISKLPCLPNICKEFQNKNLSCSDGGGFCEDNNASNNCVHKPVKDLYCKRIGIDIKASECSDNESDEPKPGWKIIKNSKGNDYCVPANFIGTPVSSTPEEVAEQCEVNSCHRKCEEKFGVASHRDGDSTQSGKCDVCDCHTSCDVNAGRLIECGNPSSKYFSVKCCKQGLFTPAGDIAGCLCKEQANNFDEKGFIKPEAQSACSKKKCPEGFVNDASGSCVAKDQPCPESCKNLILSLGNSNPSQIPPECKGCFRNRCGSDQYVDPSGICRCNSDGAVATSTGPEGCKKQTQCGNSNMIPNNIPGEAQCICPNGLPYWDDTTNSCVAQCPNGNPSASASVNLPPRSPIPCSSTNTTTNYCSPGITVGTSGCTCNPADGGYKDPSRGYCQCPSGSGRTYTKESGCSNSTSSHICAPGQEPTTGCTCASGAALGSVGGCLCLNGQTYTVDGCSKVLTGPICPTPYIKDPAFPSSCKCPEVAPYEFGTTCVATCPGNLIPTVISGGPNFNSRKVCKCSDGSYPNNNSQCGTSTTTYCSPGISTSTGCTCNPAGGAYNSNGYCQCPNGQTYTVAGCSAVSSTPRDGDTTYGGTTVTCVPGQRLNDGNVPCKCSDGAAFNAAGICECSGGLTYTHYGCKDYTKLSTCTPDQVSAYNDCKCAGTATLSNSGVAGKCVCPNKVSYSLTGCDGTTCAYPSFVYDSATKSCVCKPGLYLNPSNTNVCLPYCASGQIYYNSDWVCLCPPSATYLIYPQQKICSCTNGQTYTAAGCSSPVTCTLPKILDSVTNTCKCPSGQVQDPSNANNCVAQANCTSPKFLDPATNTCNCQQGQVQDPNNSNSCITPTVTLNGVKLNANVISFNFTNSPPAPTTPQSACFGLYSSDNTLLSKSSNGCWYSGGGYTTSVVLNNPITPGTQVKACYSADLTNCSPLVSVTAPDCAPGKASTTSNPCTCVAPATPTGSDGRCKCQIGLAYTYNPGDTSSYSCRRYCGVEEELVPASCTCGESAGTGFLDLPQEKRKFCGCSNRSIIYNSITGCGAD